MREANKVINQTVETIKTFRLQATDTLVGEAGGLCAVYEIEPSNIMPDLLRVETEHGTLYLDPESESTIIKR